jgi:hypothetical protein
MNGWRFLFTLGSLIAASAAAIIVIAMGLSELKTIGLALFLMSLAILFSIWSLESYIIDQNYLKLSKEEK